MAKSSVGARVDNLEHRVDRKEQILPTLATSEDLQNAVEPLATKQELYRRLEGVETRLRILIEAQRDDIRLIAETAADISTRLPR